MAALACAAAPSIRPATASSLLRHLGRFCSDISPLRPTPHQPAALLQLHGAKGLALPWARLAATATKGATALQLGSDAGAAGWSVGDELAVASTDYDPYQTEHVTVTAVADGGRSLQVAPPLRFMHFGEFTEGVDERAEVGGQGGQRLQRAWRAGRTGGR